MYLYTDDTFHALSVDGTAISPGTYTFTQLHSGFPANFPVTWPAQLGSSTGTNTGSGSITVLTGPPPALPATIGAVSLSGGNITLSGGGGRPSSSYQALASTNLFAPLSSWSVVGSGSFAVDGTFTVSFPVDPNQPQVFYRIRSL